MCVVCLGYGGSGMGIDSGGGWYACGTKLGYWSHVRRCRSTFRVLIDTLMMPDDTAVKVRSCVILPELRQDFISSVSCAILFTKS